VASVSGSSQGLVQIEGHVGERAYVSVFNERTEAGVITRADETGFFTAELAAEAGDLLTLWQTIEDHSSERKELMVPAADGASQAGDAGKR
jgi:hypothetical protein